MLWHNETELPKTDLKRPAIWGVRDISGRRIMAVRFKERQWRTAEIYISVLPLPVTPWRRIGLNLSLFNDCLIFFTAFCWSSLKTTFLCIGSNENPDESGKAMRSSSFTNPCLSKALQTCNGLDTNSFNDDTWTGKAADPVSYTHLTLPTIYSV